MNRQNAFTSVENDWKKVLQTKKFIASLCEHTIVNVGSALETFIEGSSSDSRIIKVQFASVITQKVNLSVLFVTSFCKKFIVSNEYIMTTSEKETALNKIF